MVLLSELTAKNQLISTDYCCLSYFQVISHPMDLSTMGAKLEGGAYSDRTEFEADFRLMIANCKQYNATGSPAYDEAEALEARFAKRLSFTPKKCILCKRDFLS